MEIYGRHRIKKSVALLISCLAVALVMMLGFVQTARADAPPAPPHQFYGTVKNNGSLVIAGYTVSAKVSGTEVASVNTDSLGRYGYDPVLYVSANAGTTIEFYVNGVKASQTGTFSSGDMTKLDLTVSGAPAPSTPVALGISTSALPIGTMNSAYSATLAASGGTSPYTWSVTSGNLPEGLTLNSSTGIISGVPTASQSASFTIQVTDGASDTSSKSFSIQVNTSSTPAQNATISTNVLGQTSSFNTTGGVVGSATSLSSSDGKVQFTLKANTAITITGESLTVTVEPSPPSPPANTKLVNAYNFGPNNTNFSPAISLTLAYDAASLPAGASETSLYIAYWSGANWISLTSEVDAQSKTVTTQASHFTIFAVMAPLGGAAAPPASTPTSTGTGFSVSNLTVSSVSVAPGEKVTITAQLTNNGGSQGSYNVVLDINGETEAEVEVTLDGGKSQKVTFKVAKEKAGAYNITIGGQSKSFVVAGAEKETQFGNISPMFIAVVGGIVVIIIILIAVVARRRS